MRRPKGPPPQAEEELWATERSPFWRRRKEEPGPCLDSEEEPKPRGGGLGSEEALKKLRYSPCGVCVCVCVCV